MFLAILLSFFFSRLQHSSREKRHKLNGTERGLHHQSLLYIYIAMVYIYYLSNLSNMFIHYTMHHIPNLLWFCYYSQPLDRGSATASMNDLVIFDRIIRELTKQSDVILHYV